MGLISGVQNVDRKVLGRDMLKQIVNPMFPKLDEKPASGGNFRWVSPAVRQGSSAAWIDAHGRSEEVPQTGWDNLEANCPQHQEGTGHPLFQNIPALLERVRNEMCRLGECNTHRQQQSCLNDFSMHCQWLAGYARIAQLHGLAQVAEALSSFLREAIDWTLEISPSTIQTLVQSVELLGLLAGANPGVVGRAEGARVLVVAREADARIRILAALEKAGIAGIGIAQACTAVGLLVNNDVDVILMRADENASVGPRFCQSVRQMSRHSMTTVMVQLPQDDLEQRSMLEISGATDIISGPLASTELTLKVLIHFFRGRISGV